ncbi:hypothetical protein CARUB_v10009233mg [Capsella rubella]|uniref:Protein kinase domain-containing protein n=1 Tax=Capsella rubella TaxID=81985 RepID=R0GXI1_9BRAS|nr:hypothetical protein CARUB_v10009233mg [Capsella rubella]
MTSSSEARFPLDAKGYELIEKVGDGVYRARCILLDEIVAIKIWNLEKCTNDLETIRNEVNKLSLVVDHPNLLRPHCSFLDSSSLWIVMPYMSCGSCFNIMKSVCLEGLEEPVIAIFLREILKALVYLHGLGHTHGNVKAGNILVDLEGTVKLADFEVSACNFGNTFVGTSWWMAPEEDMKQDDGYGFKVDIWSFGMTALELAYGHSPAILPLQKSPCLDYEEDQRFSKSFRELVAACSIEDPENCPTASKLLEYPFFQHAHSTEYLASTILDGLSPLGERYRKMKEEEANLVKGIDGNKEKLAQEKVEAQVSSGKPASSVNSVSCDAAQILPLLQNLLIQNNMQRERLIGLIELYDPTTGKFSVLSFHDLILIFVQKSEFQLSTQKAGRYQQQRQIYCLRFTFCSRALSSLRRRLRNKKQKMLS